MEVPEIETSIAKSTEIESGVLCIILLPLLLITNDRICLIDLLDFCVITTMFVRMVFLAQFPICFFDFILCGCLAHTKYIIIILTHKTKPLLINKI